MRTPGVALLLLLLPVLSTAQDTQLPDNEIVTWFLAGENSGDWSCQCSKAVTNPCPKDVDCSAIQCGDALSVSCSQVWYFGGGGGSTTSSSTPSPPVSRGGTGTDEVWRCGCTSSKDEAWPCPPDAACPAVACDAGTYLQCYPASWAYRGTAVGSSGGSTGSSSSGGTSPGNGWTCGCSSDPKAEKQCPDDPDCQYVLASTSCSTSAPYVVCEENLPDVPPPEGNTWTCGCSSDPKAEKQCPDDPDCQYVLASTSCLTSSPYVVCEENLPDVPPPEGNTWTCGCSSDPKAEKQCPDDPDCQYVLASTSCLTSSPYVVCEEHLPDVPPPEGITWTCGCSSEPKAEKQCPDDPHCQYVLASTSCLTSSPYVVCKENLPDVPPPQGNTWTCGCSSDPKAEKQCPDDPNCQYVLASTSCLTSAPYVVCEQADAATEPNWECTCVSKAKDAAPCPRDDPGCPLLKCPAASPFVRCEQRWYLDAGAAAAAASPPPHRGSSNRPSPKGASPSTRAPRPLPKRGSLKPAPKLAPKPAVKPAPKQAPKSTPKPAGKTALAPRLVPKSGVPKPAPKLSPKLAAAAPHPKAAIPKPVPKSQHKPASGPNPKPAAKPAPKQAPKLGGASGTPKPTLTPKPVRKPTPKPAGKPNTTGATRPPPKSGTRAAPKQNRKLAALSVSL